MACTNCSNCGCSNCHCKETDVCQSNEELSSSIHDKLSLLKDYVCVLGAATCQSIVRAVTKYAFFVWCFLRDLTNIVMMHDKRLDCLEERINKLTKFILDSTLNNVAFDLIAKGSQDGPVATNVTTNKDGTFEITWEMHDTVDFVGSGKVAGKVEHDFSVDEDGSINVNIKSIYIDNVTYTATKNNGSGNARFVVKDKDGNAVFDKSYNPYQSWSEQTQKTVTYNHIKNLAPSGASTGDYLVLKTEDTWIGSPTYGEVYINYVNNNIPVDISNTECGRCVTGSENEEGGSANA